MKNLFIKVALFVLRKHWIKPNRKADVTLPTYYLDIAELRIPEGKAVTFKSVPRDFSELYFFPSIASSILSSIRPSIELNMNVIKDPNHEFKIVLKTGHAGDLQEAHLIDDHTATKLA